MRFTRWDYLAFPVLAALLLGAFFGALRLVGFFGVGLLGLIIALITVRIDLDADSPATGMVAWSRMAETMSKAEKAEMRAARDRRRRPLFVAQIVAVGFIILGFGLHLFL